MVKVLAISAHPDDETGFAGGLLAKYGEEGAQVYLVETTHGEGGEVGDPPVGPKARLGEYREQELRCAAAALGIQEIIYLGFIDPSIEIGEPPRPIEVDIEQFTAAVADQIARIRPDVIVTHGTNGEYGHPQHVYTLLAVREALRNLSPWFPAEFLTWCADAGVNAEDRLTNRSDPASFSLDISPWFEKKVAAMECHRSQHAMFLRNSKVARVRDMVRKLEAYRRWSREELLTTEPAAAPAEASADWRPR